MELNDYIDVEGALKRVGGNMGLYKKLLGRYVDGKTFDLLNDAIQGGNMEEASHLAHTLKGVCSNLSLNKIAALAADIEQIIKAGSDYNDCLGQLKDACDVTEVKIAELLAG